MSRALDSRLYRLESSLRQPGKPVVMFLLDETCAGWQEQQTEIEQLKQAGRCLILLTDGNGGEAWEGQEMVFSI